MPKFYFTMSRNQIRHFWPASSLSGGCVEVEAVDSVAARDLMVATFEGRWAFQYDALEKVHPSDQHILRVL